MASVGLCKGSLLHHVERFVTERDGAGEWRRTVAALPDADRVVLEGIVLTGGWYPVGVWNRLLARYLAGRPPQRMTELAGYVAEHDLNTVFKLVLKMGSPEFVLQRTPSLYARYFDKAGNVTAERIDVREWRLRLVAATGEDEAPSQWTCVQGVEGWVEHALVLTGAKQAKVVHERCRHDGAPACEYRATW